MSHLVDHYQTSGPSPCQAPPPAPLAPECSSTLGQRLPQLSKTLGREEQSQLGSGRASEENKGAHHWSQGGKSGVIRSSDWCWDHPCMHPSPCQAPLWSSRPTGQLSTRAKAAISEERAQLRRPGQAQAPHRIATRKGHPFLAFTAAGAHSSL